MLTGAIDGCLGKSENHKDMALKIIGLLAEKRKRKRGSGVPINANEPRRKRIQAAPPLNPGFLKIGGEGGFI